MAHTSPWLWTRRPRNSLNRRSARPSAGAGASVGRTALAEGHCMAHIVVLGAGLGGMPMAYEMRELARRDDTVTVVSNSPRFQLRPQQSVGRGQLADAEGHRDRHRPGAQAQGHRLRPGRRETRAPGREPDRAGRRQQHRLRLPGDRDRPEARVRRGPRPGARDRRRPHAVGLPRRSRGRGGAALAGVRRGPGADRRRRGAGGVVLRPGLRVRDDHGHRPAAPQDPRQGADDLRHRRAVRRPPRPRRRRRLEGPARVGDARAPHQVDLQREDDPRRARARCSSPSTTRRASRRRSTSCRSATR